MEGISIGKKLKPALVSRFLDIRESAPVNPIETNFSSIFDDEKYRKHCFKEARRSFEFVFDKEKITRHIQREVNEKSFTYLKKVRRYGLILRAMYQFVDSSHKCPENLQKFLSFLGKYNDSYWVSPSQEAKKEVMNNLGNIEFPINLVDTSEFKKYARNSLSDIDALLVEKALPIEKFHTLRKRLRLFADLMQVPAAENYGGNLHQLFYSIIELSSELGKEHSNLIEKGLNGEVEYQTQVLEVNPHVGSEFKRIKPFIERVCGLIE